MKCNYAILFFAVATVLSLSSCHQTTDEDRAQQLIAVIEADLGRGDFKTALDSISSLRRQYPKAVEARKQAIKLWQDASLLQAQHNIQVVDSMLQATVEAIDNAPTLLEQNMLRNKRDSLKARYDAECGLVRIIRAKQNGK